MIHINSNITFFMLLLMWYNTSMKNKHKNIDSNENDWQIIPTEPELQQVQEFLQIAAETSISDKYSRQPVIIY